MSGVKEFCLNIKRITIYVWIVLLTLPAYFTTCYATGISWHASGNGGVVAAGPRESVQAGIDILGKGGNAVDGAVATIFNLAVSDYGSFCIGGEVPFMYYSNSSGRVIVFNGMGSAPGDHKAIEWYYANGIPGSGIRSATVPSAVSTLLTALELKGTMSFKQIIAPTLALLDRGGEKWHSNLAMTLRKLIYTEKNTPGTREQKIRAARDRFYKEDIADELNNYYVSSGAFLRKSDLEAHTTTIEEPVTVKYRGYDVYKCNTWTQGPVLLQSLRLLENFDLKSMRYFSPDYIHATVEAMKLAFADRDKYYGDPEFVKMPKDAITSPRFKTYQTENSFNPSPDSEKRIFKIGALDIDSTSQSIIGNLKNRGHNVNIATELIGDPIMIYLDQATGISYAAGEPRYSRGKFCAALNTPGAVR